MICLYHWLPFLLISCTLHPGKQDSSKLLLLASHQLENGFPVSSILSDTSFMAIHANSSFRRLIRKYAGTDPLTIAAASEPGERIVVTGYVKNKQGGSVRGAIVYCYQTDERGFYGMKATHVTGDQGDRQHARLFGYLITDSAGCFVIHTIHPRGYPKSSLPAHIHCEVEAPGYNTLITELLFDEDPRLQGDQRTRSTGEGFIIAVGVHGQYVYQIELHKEG